MGLCGQRINKGDIFFLFIFHIFPIYFYKKISIPPFLLVFCVGKIQRLVSQKVTPALCRSYSKQIKILLYLNRKVLLINASLYRFYFQFIDFIFKLNFNCQNE